MAATGQNTAALQSQVTVQPSTAGSSLSTVPSPASEALRLVNASDLKWPLSLTLFFPSNLDNTFFK